MRQRLIAVVFLLFGLAPAHAQQLPQTLPDHTVLGRLGSGGSSGPIQAIPFATVAPFVLSAANGTSVVNPGTGVLEMVLPIQTVTGASKTFATADLFKKTRRSNSGTAMSDTLPAATAVGLVNGTRIVIANVDASATDTLTAGTGTSIAAGCAAIGPGRDETLVYDLANTTWRGDANTCASLLSANNLSDVASASTSRSNLGLASLYSNSCPSHQWISSVAAGVPACVQPSAGDLSSISGDTVLANFSGSSAAPSAASMPSCSGASNALTYNTSTHAIGCNTISGGSGSSSGGFVNRLRNGTFSVWQRLTSALSTSTSAPGSYTADGWQVQQSGAAGSCAQDTGNNGTKFSLKCVGNTSNTDTIIRQPIESVDAYPLASATVTVQFQYKQDTGSSVTPKLSTCYASASDNFSTCTSDLASTSLTSCASGSWCTEAYTLSVSANATNGYRVEFDCNTALSSSQHCWITTADVRVTPGVSTGINASPPSPELRPIGAELALCQRYFLAYNAPSASGTGLFMGQAQSGTVANMVWTFPVQMRVPPTGGTVSSASHFGVTSSSGTGLTTTSITFNNFSVLTASMSWNVSSGLTAGNASQSFSQSASGQLTLTGAEL